MTFGLKFNSSYDTLPKVGEAIIWFEPDQGFSIAMELHQGTTYRLAREIHGVVNGVEHTEHSVVLIVNGDTSGYEMSTCENDGSPIFWTYAEEVFDRLEKAMLPSNPKENPDEAR